MFNRIQVFMLYGELTGNGGCLFCLFKCEIELLFKQNVQNK